MSASPSYSLCRGQREKPEHHLISIYQSPLPNPSSQAFHIRSTYYGWAALGVAGAGAYYFAKRSINADRQSVHNEMMAQKARLQTLEAASYSPEPARAPKKSKNKASEGGSGGGQQQEPAVKVGKNDKGLDHAGSPSSEASQDAAPVGHAPETEGQKVRERSKYEAAEPFRSKKGNRFS
ncbi:MAG: hypothetical protein Q9227_003414 [Pyrenula ochraceoflavens]